MANERRWYAVQQAFTANGTLQGKITVADTAGFYVKSKVRIISNTQSAILLEVKRIDNTTDIYVGDPTKDINDRYDLSAFLLVDAPTVTLYEQLMPTIKSEDFWQAVYVREPVVAMRSIFVDKYGRFYDNDNPLPVNASVSIGDVNIGTDGYSTLLPDSMNITGSVDGSKTGVKYGFVNNLRLQILSAHDRDMNITYADFGTKNERITNIIYTSPTFPGVSAAKTIAYTLVSGKYRRDSITWSII